MPGWRSDEAAARIHSGRFHSGLSAPVFSKGEVPSGMSVRRGMPSGVKAGAVSSTTRPKGRRSSAVAGVSSSRQTRVLAVSCWRGRRTCCVGLRVPCWRSTSVVRRAKSSASCLGTTAGAGGEGALMAGDLAASGAGVPDERACWIWRSVTSERDCAIKPVRFTAGRTKAGRSSATSDVVTAAGVLIVPKAVVGGVFLALSTLAALSAGPPLAGRGIADAASPGAAAWGGAVPRRSLLATFADWPPGARFGCGAVCPPETGLLGDAPVLSGTESGVEAAGTAATPAGEMPGFAVVGAGGVPALFSGVELVLVAMVPPAVVLGVPPAGGWVGVPPADGLAAGLSPVTTEETGAEAGPASAGGWPLSPGTATLPPGALRNQSSGATLPSTSRSGPSCSTPTAVSGSLSFSGAVFFPPETKAKVMTSRSAAAPPKAMSLRRLVSGGRADGIGSGMAGGRWLGDGRGFPMKRQAARFFPVLRYSSAPPKIASA